MLLRIVLLLLLLTACVAPDPQTQPRAGRAGLQLTGTVDGRQLAVSAGAPRLNVGDCDPAGGPDRDVCIITEDIDGELVVLVFENPGVLAAGTTLPVAAPHCPTSRDCDEVTDVAIVALQVGVGERIRATGGRLRVEVAEPFLRYRGDLRLELPNGAVSGTFDVVPRRD